MGSAGTTETVGLLSTGTETKSKFSFIISKGELSWEYMFMFLSARSNSEGL